MDVLVVCGLVLLNAALALAEMSLVASRRARLKQIAESAKSAARRRTARLALRLLDDPSQFLSAAQTGITLIGVLAGAYSGVRLSEPVARWLENFAFLQSYAQPLSLALVVTSITFFSLVIGELVPKRIAIAHAETIAVVMATPIQIMTRVFAPIVWLLKFSTEGILKILGIRTDNKSEVSEDEIRLMIAEGTEKGVFEAQEQNMIEGVFRLSDRSVRSLMTPRTAIEWIDIQDGLETLPQQIADFPHARVVICDGEIDELVGVVQKREIAESLLRGKAFDVKEFLRQPEVIPETAGALTLLEQFRTSGNHLAIVVDEYGSCIGLVTLSDIVAAVTGELSEGVSDEPAYAQREDGSYLIDGMMPLDDIESLLNKNFDVDGDYETLAGYVLHHIGRIPKAGDHVTVGNLRFEVVDMDGRRIDKILVNILT